MMSKRKRHAALKEQNEQEELSAEEMQEKQKDPRHAAWYERFPTREAVLKAVRLDGSVFRSALAPEEVRADPEIALVAIRKYEGALPFASLREDRDFVWKAVCVNHRALKFALREFRGDRQIVMQAVRKKGSLLQYALPELQNDREVVLAAVRSEAHAFQYASQELRADQRVAMEAVSKTGYLLQNASFELCHDREVVLAAIRSYAGALEFASRDLRADAQIVTEAVTSNGRALEFASQDLWEDPNIVGLALCSLEPNIGMQNVIGPTLKTKLRTVLRQLQQEMRGRGDLQEREYFEDIESVQQCANQWRQRAFEKVCLLWKICRETGVALDQYQTILDFWDAKPDFQPAKDLEYCAPVLEAFGKRECSFRQAETMLYKCGFSFPRSRRKYKRKRTRIH